jgi:hypothetical protein
MRLDMRNLLFVPDPRIEPGKDATVPASMAGTDAIYRETVAVAAART